MLYIFGISTNGNAPSKPKQPSCQKPLKTPYLVGLKKEKHVQNNIPRRIRGNMKKGLSLIKLCPMGHHELQFLGSAFR